MSKAYEYVPRHVKVRGKDTVVSIEQVYWSAIDLLADVGKPKRTPELLLERIIAIKPSGYKSRAGWIRHFVTHQYFKALKNAKPAAASVGDLTPSTTVLS